MQAAAVILQISCFLLGLTTTGSSDFSEKNRQNVQLMLKNTALLEGKVTEIATTRGRNFTEPLCKITVASMLAAASVKMQKKILTVNPSAHLGESRVFF